MSTLAEQIEAEIKLIEEAKARITQLQIRAQRELVNSYDLVSLSELYEGDLDERLLPAGNYFIRYETDYPIQLDWDAEFNLVDRPDHSSWVSGYQLYIQTED